MPRFRVDIDGAVYEGTYRTMPDAVYGALLKLYADSNNEAHASQDFDFSSHPANAGKWLIGVESIRQTGASRGKAKRVR